jgi:hypothetical protein
MLALSTPSPGSRPPGRRARRVRFLPTACLPRTGGFWMRGSHPSTAPQQPVMRRSLARSKPREIASSCSESPASSASSAAMSGRSNAQQLLTAPMTFQKQP